MAVCLNHTDREATTKCAACLKPLCDECAKPAGGKVFCSEACMQNAVASGDRMAEVAARDRAIRRKKLIKRAITLLILAGIAAGAYVYLKNDPSTAQRLKREAQSLQKKVQSGAQELKKEMEEK